MAVITATASLITGFRRGLTNNSTDADYPSIVPTTTKPVTVDSDTPTGNLFVVRCSGSKTHLMFFGTDADNEQFQARVVLWRKAVNNVNVSDTELWIPYVVGDFEITLSATMKGVSGAILSELEFIADTVTEVSTTWDDNLVTVTSPTGDKPALVKINTVGFELLSVYFDRDAATTDAATANALYAYEH